MEFRIATEKDTERIWNFFKTHEFTEEGISEYDFKQFIKKMYYENPSKKHYQIVAEDGDAIVAHEAIIPLSYHFYNQKVCLGLGSNTLIDEKHRQMLLFLKMQNYFFSNYTKSGLDFTYGLVTRQDVLKIHLKTGYKKIGDVFVYARPYRIQKILSRRIKQRIISSFLNLFSPIVNFILRINLSQKSNLEVILVESFLPEWESAIKNLNGQFSITGSRDVAILNWRFNELTYRNYKVYVAQDKGIFKGYIVIRPMKMQEFSTIAVVDILAKESDTSTINALLSAVHNVAIKEKVDLVSTILTDHSIFKQYFKKSLFFKTPEFFTLVADQPKVSSFKISEDLFKAWNITWFDHDFV